MKMNFEHFQIQKWMSQTVKAKKVSGKNGVIWVVSMFPAKIMVLKLSKKLHFLQFVLISARNLSILKQFKYISERSRFGLSENGIVYYAMIYCFGDIRVWSQRTLLNFYWVSILFYILITNISWQARNQEFFRAGEVSWNEGTSINVSCEAHKRKALQRKIFVFFLQDALKITFQLRILTHGYTQTGQIFPKSGHFFAKSGLFFSIFKKRLGRPPPILPASCSPARTAAQTPINHTIFWKCVMGTFRCE